MKKLVITGLFLIIALFAWAQEGVNFYSGTLKEAFEAARKEKRLLFVDVYTAWCGPCQMMLKQVFPKPEVGEFFNKHFVSYKLDAEKDEGVAFAKKYGVQVYPTFLLLRPDGTEQHRVLGAYLDVDQFLLILKKGMQEKTSLSYLVEKYKAGTLTRKDIIDGHETFQAAGNRELMNEVYDSLFVQLSERERCDSKYEWLYGMESGDVLSTQRIAWLIEHIDKFPENQEKWRKDIHTLFTSNLIAPKTKLHEVRRLIQNIVMPDQEVLLAWCDLAMAGEAQQLELAQVAVEKLIALQETQRYASHLLTLWQKRFPHRQEETMQMRKAWNQPYFSLSGTLPGIKDGTTVLLMNLEKEEPDTLAVTTAHDERFVLEGAVGWPTLSELVIPKIVEQEGQKPLQSKLFMKMIVENVPMKLTAPHVDSLPTFWTWDATALLHEKQVIVTGGEAQRQYAEYRTFMLPLEIARSQAGTALGRYIFSAVKPGEEKAAADARQRYTQADAAFQVQRKEFIRQHLSYSITVKLIRDDLEPKFRYTVAQLDSIVESVKTCKDWKRLGQLRAYIGEYKKLYALGLSYTDFVMLTPDATERKLSDLFQSGRYVLVDFWASWCAPCRAAIPRIRELGRQFDEKLTLYSVSMDNRKEAWQKAMDEEQMEWEQFWLSPELSKPVMKRYQIQGIPYLLLIDPEGRIVYTGHDTDAVRAVLQSEGITLNK